MGKRFNFEYIIIGGGLAGVSAAKQLAEAGRKVAIVEKARLLENHFHGYPFAAQVLFHTSHLYSDIVKNGGHLGLSSSNLHYDYPATLKWYDHAVKKAEKVEQELKSLGVTIIKGKAHFIGAFDLAIEPENLAETAKEEKKINKAATKNAEAIPEEAFTVSASKFLIATGTELNTAGISGLDRVPYLSPTSALKVSQPPKAVLIVGGGPTGCEIAQYYAELGAKVVIVELSDRILPKEDEEVGKLMEQYLSKRFNIKIFTQTRVTALEKDKISARAVFLKNGKERTVRINTVVLATGYKPILDIDLQKAGVSFDKKGIIINRTLQTSAHHIFAAGDVLGGQGSPEKSVYTGEVAVMNMLDRTKTYISYEGFMRHIHTSPEVAIVGQTEDDLMKQSQKYCRILLPLSAVSASDASGEKIGFIKILADRQGKILGASMFGPNASEILQEIALAIRHNISLVEIASTPHHESDWNNLVKVAARKLLTKK